jgi:hypothetical protein
MKRWRWGFGLVALAVVFTASPATANVAVGFGVFYSSLAPHGEWITVEGGTYAWRPTGVGVEWRPYWRGRWMWTDWGWYWTSPEPWSWATYHYGRWYYDDYYGWIWIPGYEWAPAWVEWRYGPDCVGWAPLGPYAVFTLHFGVYYTNAWVTPYHYWSFVPHRYFGHHDVHRYVHRTEENVRFIGRTRTGGTVRYEKGHIRSRGPDRTYVERHGHVRIPRADVVDVRDRGEERVMRDGERERIAVYRPRIDGVRNPVAADRPPVVRESDRLPSLDLRDIDLRVGRDREERREAVGRERWDRSAPPVGGTTPELRDQKERGERPALRPMRIPDEGMRGVERQPAPRLNRESGRERGEPRVASPVPRIERDNRLIERPEQPVMRDQRSRPASTPTVTPQGRDRNERSPRSR